MAFAASSACLSSAAARDRLPLLQKLASPKVTGVKSSYGSDFNVTGLGERAIDPKFLSVGAEAARRTDLLTG